MKIYILADMEGISGIRRVEQVQSESKAYEIIRKAARKAITSIDTFKPYKPSCKSIFGCQFKG